MIDMLRTGHTGPDAPRGRQEGRRGSRRRARASRRRRILIGVAGALAVLLGATMITVVMLNKGLQDQVGRIDGVFDGIDERERPKLVTGTGTNFLLVGSDTRSDAPTTGRDAAPLDGGNGRSDVLMLAHLSEDENHASVISIPRDSWVDVPGHGKDKINHAYNYGGPTMAIRTVEQLTGVRIDHFAVIDFAGFRRVVDAIGGVTVPVAHATCDGGICFAKGLNHLDGTEALAYVRQRHNLKEGDFDRARRQQNLMRAIMKKAHDNNTKNNPVKLYQFMDAVTRYVSVDTGLSNSELNSLTTTMLGLKARETGFLLAPVLRVGQEGKLSVVHLDTGRCAELWDAIRTDQMPAYLEKHPTERLAQVPR